MTARPNSSLARPAKFVAYPRAAWPKSGQKVAATGSLGLCWLVSSTIPRHDLPMCVPRMRRVFLPLMGEHASIEACPLSGKTTFRAIQKFFAGNRA